MRETSLLVQASVDAIRTGLLAAGGRASEVDRVARGVVHAVAGRFDRVHIRRIGGAVEVRPEGEENEVFVYAV